MNNQKLQYLLVGLALATALVGCGGGGGSSNPNNHPAAITGASAGTVSLANVNAQGTLTVTDADLGQATFTQPTALTGTYGTWSVSVAGASLTWRYALDPAKLSAPRSGQSLSESLRVVSADGTADQNVQVTILQPVVTTVTSVPAATYTPGGPQAQVYDYLNARRSQCGFGLLAQDPMLDAAAAAHAAYILANNVASHDEIQGNPGFMGTTPANRALAAQYPSWSYAVSGGTYTVSGEIASFRPTALNGIRSLLSAPYHMVGAMTSQRDLGISFQTTSQNQSIMSTLVVDFGVKSTSPSFQQPAPGTVLTYPCEGVADMAPEFSESSNWRAPTGVGTGGAGLVVKAPNFKTVTMSFAQLTKADGTVIETNILTQQNDPQKMLQAYEALVIPSNSLDVNSTYHWNVQGTVAGQPFTKSFSFQTGARAF